MIHEVEGEREVVTGCEAVREELLGPEQVRQVRPRELPAEDARAAGLNRLRIVEEATVAKVELAAGDSDSPGIEITGDADALPSIIAVVDRPDPNFNIITP